MRESVVVLKAPFVSARGAKRPLEGSTVTIGTRGIQHTCQLTRVLLEPASLAAHCLRLEANRSRRVLQLKRQMLVTRALPINRLLDIDDFSEQAPGGNWGADFLDPVGSLRSLKHSFQGLR
jgi:hypothetical protein